MTKESLRADIEWEHKQLMRAYEPSKYAVETTLSKCAYYQEQYGKDQEVENMAKELYYHFIK